MPPQTVLVTGATGLVGDELLKQLEHVGVHVMGVARKVPPRGSLSNIVAWDMGQEPLPDELRRPWGAIVHTAANTRWTMRPEEAQVANVATVRALEPLVQPSTHLIHVSTAYAVGLNASGASDLHEFRNTYEWSKAHAERVARQICNRVTVVRPPLIIGRRTDGRAARFAGMYTLIRGLTLGTVPAIVADPGAPFDAIPVDDLGRALVRLIEDAPSKATLTIAGGSSAPTVAEAVGAIVESLNSWRERHGAPALSSPPLITPESWDRFFRPFVKDHLSSRQLMILELLESFAPYLALQEPLSADHRIENVLPCIQASTNYWAEMNPRLSRRVPRPWTGLDQATDRTVEVTRCPS